MGRKLIHIEPGDVFRKNEKFESLWVVTGLLDLFGYPPHVHITSMKDSRHPLTYSIAALSNPNLFIKIPS
jgi:hypothetical protein